MLCIVLGWLLNQNNGDTKTNNSHIFLDQSVEVYVCRKTIKVLKTRKRSFD